MSGSKGQQIISKWKATSDGRQGLADSIDAAIRAAKVEAWKEAAQAHASKDGNQCEYCLARIAELEREGE